MIYGNVRLCASQRQEMCHYTLVGWWKGWEILKKHATSLFYNQNSLALAVNNKSLFVGQL